MSVFLFFKEISTYTDMRGIKRRHMIKNIKYSKFIVKEVEYDK